MRPKVILAVLLTGAVAMLTMAWLAGLFRPPASAPVPAGEPAPQVASPRASSPRRAEPLTNPWPAPPALAASGSDLSPAAAADPNSPEAVLADLQSPLREVRLAAAERAKQVEDRSIVPRLREIADRTDDPAEKAAIEDAINFINLPSLTEYLAEQRSNRAALGLPEPQPNTNNRPLRRPPPGPAGRAPIAPPAQDATNAPNTP